MFNKVEDVEENGLIKNNEDKYNNENINENNINYNWKQNEGFKKLCKKIDFNNEDKNETNIYIIESGAILSDIMNMHKNSRKFDYKIQTINTDFNDFINLCDFNNDENKNIENITNYNTPSSRFIQLNSHQKNSYLKKPFQKINSNNNDKYIILENGQRQLNKNSLTCTCKNSSCLKFYCECFSNGKYCQNCTCINCKNITQFESLRQEKYKSIIERNPKAIYQINSVKKSFTCNCKNSNCEKKYCDCFQSGKSCTSKCKCINCLNRVIIKNNNNNNNNRKRKNMKRIRGVKNNINDIYLTPKRKRRRNHKYDIYQSKNQSTAAITEMKTNNSTNNKNIMFNTELNRDKFKEVSKRLKMEVNNKYIE